jgi:uncharacterized membrane protein
MADPEPPAAAPEPPAEGAPAAAPAGGAEPDAGAAEDRTELAAESRAEADASAAERMTFFSDAVVAIAMTLLVLDLPLPHGRTNGELLRYFWTNRDDYSVFVISFAVIAGHWGAHHRFFRYVARLGGHLSGLNLIWLFTVVITPFATRFLSASDSGGGFGVRFGLYALTQVVGWLALLEMSRECVADHLLRPGTPAGVTSGDNQHILVMAAVFLVSIPVAFVTRWAFICWILIPAVNRVVRAVTRRRSGGSGGVPAAAAR